jgi:hypothetical protein
LSFLAPVAALVVGVVVISRGSRVRAAALFGVPLLLAGGYWYVRNLVTVGNPIPFTSWGPLDLPMPERDFELRPGFSVFHYLNDTDVWSDWFGPGLDESFGLLWPATLLAMLGGAGYAVLRAREPILRALGAMVLVTAVAYVFTPLTAGGEEGMPIAFEWNVRYLAPAAAVGLAILPCLPLLRESPGRRAATLAGLSVLLAVTIASLVQWDQGHTKGAIAAGVATLAVLGGAAWLRQRGWLGPRATTARLAAIGAVALAGAVAAGWAHQDHYLTHRYENTSPHLKLAEAIRWGRDLRDARVAVSGIRGVFNQYAFYGTDLSNHVQWLGKEGDDGAYLRIPTCSEWRQALSEGEFTHVVTTYDPFAPGRLADTKEGLWTREDPASKEILRDGPVSIFEIEGELAPAACDDLPALVPAELDGDSVNEEPLANQP